MKKHYLAIAIMAAAVGITACSSKPQETTAATTAAETTQEPSSEEDTEEEDFVDGMVTAVDGSTITVTADDGTESSFDISTAELTGSDAVGTGDEVEVVFAGEKQDVTRAKSVDVMMSAAEQAEEAAAAEEDPQVAGTIESSGDGTLTLKTDDGNYTFNSKIAQVVTKDGVKAGVGAEVTYYGDLEDTEDKPVATRIVTDDAADTEEASVKTLTGKVAEVGADYVVLDTVDPENTLYTFLGTQGMFDSLKVGDEATVVYEGTLTSKTITATGLQK